MIERDKTASSEREASSGVDSSADERLAASIPTKVDVTKPSVARGYDYLLGGKDNFAVDRAFAQEWIDNAPGIVDEALENRAFLGRVVDYLAGEAGIRQFIDLGTGLPTQENVHQVAQRVAPGARVVYVDNDPIVLAHGRALLATNDATTVITADMRRPEQILADSDLRKLIDVDEPVAVLFISVLHCIPDADDPAGIVGKMLEAFPPGSYLALSHLVSDDPVAAEQLTAMMLAKTEWGRVRSPEETRAFFDGLELVEPGLVDVRQWRPRAAPGAPIEDRNVWEYGGVARKPTV